jgi:hypothetical protein
MSDPRSTPDRDGSHASRARRRDAALFAEYIHELSDRHGGAAHDEVDPERAGDGPHAEEGS